MIRDAIGGRPTMAISDLMLNLPMQRDADGGWTRGALGGSQL